MVLSLLYGIRNIDFFQFRQSIIALDVYPFLLIFAVLLPIFIFAENKADDPVMNLSYFTNFKIVITLLLSIVTGVILMGMIFVPQFSENVLKIASGSGGYFVIILGAFAGVGAPFSGKLIDRFGAKLVLGVGFFLSIAGSLFLTLVTIPYPSFLTVFVSLMLIGLGVGFTMGTPLNYMMLANTRKEESNSALATLSLVRSIGTAIAPAIMIGFLAHAGGNIQDNIMNLLPKEISVPQLPYAQELNKKLSDMKVDPKMKDKLAGLDFPDLNSMTAVKIDMNSGDGKIPESLIEQMKTADVTNITERTRFFASEMFKLTTPKIVSNIENGVQKGIDALSTAKVDLTKQLEDLKKAGSGATAGTDKMQGGNPAGMEAAVKGINSAISEMDITLLQMKTLKAAVPGAFDKNCASC